MRRQSSTLPRIARCHHSLRHQAKETQCDLSGGVLNAAEGYLLAFDLLTNTVLLELNLKDADTCQNTSPSWPTFATFATKAFGSAHTRHHPHRANLQCNRLDEGRKPLWGWQQALKTLHLGVNRLGVEGAQITA